MSELALAGSGGAPPSASTVLKGRLQFTASIVPFDVPVPAVPCAVFPMEPGVTPAAPGSKMSKLDQSCPTCGSCASVTASSVVDCSPDSVLNKGTSAVTTTFWATEP